MIGEPGEGGLFFENELTDEEGGGAAGAFYIDDGDGSGFHLDGDALRASRKHEAAVGGRRKAGVLKLLGQAAPGAGIGDVNGGLGDGGGEFEEERPGGAGLVLDLFLE